MQRPEPHAEPAGGVRAHAPRPGAVARMCPDPQPLPRAEAGAFELDGTGVDQPQAGSTAARPVRPSGRGRARRQDRCHAHAHEEAACSHVPIVPAPLTTTPRRERVRRMLGSEWGIRDRRVWHQMSGRPPEGAKPPIILESGDGAWVTDVEGNRYLDGLSGQWCVNVGYGRERLADAAAEQLKKLAFHPLTRGHVPAIELGERLDALLGGNRATFYSNSGSEANELAFKLVRQYQIGRASGRERA